jgi:rubrerythrin
MGTKAQRRAWGRAYSEDEGAVQDVELQIEDSGLADFKVAGTAVSGEFRCGACGYRAVVRRALPLCPMCGGTVWESRTPHLVD